MTIIATNPDLSLPDFVGPYGTAGLAYAVNNYSGSRVDITTAGTNSNLTAANFRNGWIFLNPGASGAFTVTMPSTASIMTLMVPLAGGNIGGANVFTKPFAIVNNAVGFTGTLTAGDGSTTLSGELTIPSLFARWFLLTATASTTIRIQNIGVAPLAFGAATTITANPGGGQGSAVAITTYLTRVGAVVTDGDSVLLPLSAGIGGPPFVVTNFGAKSMDVFPQVGDAINLLAANTALAVASGTTVLFYDITSGTWASK